MGRVNLLALALSLPICGCRTSGSDWTFKFDPFGGIFDDGIFGPKPGAYEWQHQQLVDQGYGFKNSNAD